MSIEIGTTVKRIASDYTNGRIGRVIEKDMLKPRVRVAWEKEADGQPMKLRTWVRTQDLQPVTVTESNSEGFETLELAQWYLTSSGWKHYHAGLYTHPQRPGVRREIRRPDQKAFVIVETSTR